MTSAVLNVQDGTTLSLQSHLKNVIGKSLCGVFPKKARSIYRRPIDECHTVIDRSMRYYLRSRSLRENQDRFLARLHAEFWSGDGGAVFSENCDYRFDDYFMQHHETDFRVLEKLWGEKSCIRNVVEIGTSSGLLLNHMCNTFDAVENAVGIDINASQIEKNRHDFVDSNMTFHCGDGVQWVRQNAQPGTLFVTNGGVLEYFPESRIRSLLSDIRRRLMPALVFFSEPIAQDFDLDADKCSLPFGDELSFSHNYPLLLQDNGFDVVSCRETQCEEYRMITTVAVLES